MARSYRKQKDIDALYKKHRLESSPQTPFLLRVQLTGLGKRGGYLSRLSRQSRKTGSILKGLPGSGPSLKDDWFL